MLWFNLRKSAGVCLMGNSMEISGNNELVTIIWEWVWNSMGLSGHGGGNELSKIWNLVG